MAKRETQTIGSGDVEEISAETLGSNVNYGDTPDGWVEEQTGFPPYWNPELANPGEVCKRFQGIVIGKDDRDPDFIRFVLKATKTIMCGEGPKDDKADIEVQEGQYFSVSDYVALPLEKYIGHEVLVMSVSKRKIDGGKSLWKWRLMVSPETRKAIAAAEAKMLAEANALFTKDSPKIHDAKDETAAAS